MRTPFTVVAPLILLVVAIPSPAAGQVLGGFSGSSVTNERVVAAARFAVETQAAKSDQKGAIVLVEVLSVQQQVVAGMNYRLRLKVTVDGKDREAEAVVWRKLSGEHELRSWGWK